MSLRVEDGRTVILKSEEVIQKQDDMPVNFESLQAGGVSGLQFGIEFRFCLRYSNILRNLISVCFFSHYYLHLYITEVWLLCCNSRRSDYWAPGYRYSLYFMDCLIRSRLSSQPQRETHVTHFQPLLL